MPLIEFTPAGMYCPIGDFYIDPWLPVDRAVITHAHSDHARSGMGHYLCHTLTAPLLRARLQVENIQTLAWNEPIDIQGVRISLHPAGHVIGSSQIRLEYKGEVWAVTGDYKVANDGISGAFEPIRCNTLVTESTFGLPIYQWQPQETLYEEMRQWATATVAKKKTALFIAYSLGKAQRVLDALKPLRKNILVHGAVWNMQEALQASGIDFGLIERVTPETPKEKLKGAIVVAPPGAEGQGWRRKFEPVSLAICSGWMQVRGNVRRKNADAGFVLSDHADWPGLLEAVRASSAQMVYVTHGFQAVFSKYLSESGIESREITTRFGEEETVKTEESDE